MAKAILDSLDGLSADLRNEYRPGTKEEKLEGKFVLKVDSVDGWGLEPVAALKSSLSNAKTERDAAKRIIKELGDDFSVDEYKAAMAELTALKSGSSSDKVKAEIDGIKKQLTDKHTKELATLNATLSERDSEVGELLIDTEVNSVCNDPAISGRAKLILPAVKQYATVVRVEKTMPDGKKRMVPKAIIRNPDGSARMSTKQGSQDDMSIREFIETLKATDDYAPAFGGSGASGTAGVGQRKVDAPNPTNQGGGAGHGNQQQGRSAVQVLRDQRRAAEGKK